MRLGKNATAPPIPSGLRGRTPEGYCLKFSRRSFWLSPYSTYPYLFNSFFLIPQCKAKYQCAADELGYGHRFAQKQDGDADGDERVDVA